MLEAPYALLPVDLLLTQRFDSIVKVGQLRLPVLYIHGTADEIVPFEMGKALYNATPFARGFVAVPAGRHEDNAAVGAAGLRSAISCFIEGAMQSRARTTPANCCKFQTQVAELTASPFASIAP
jgi:pimeloyl-ACP methyl ester carboxylesterase